MHDAHLLELSQFQFPSIEINEFTKEPYLSYLQIYKETYSEFKFYRGFIRPDAVERAKIYRAIVLSCGDDIFMKNFMIFNTNDGLIIKFQETGTSSDFTQKFDHHMSQGKNYVFIPKNCDKLDRYNYSYYRRMLNNFITNEQIPGKAIRMNETDDLLLFLSFDECSNPSTEEYEKKWKEYLQGGVLRKFEISADKLCTAFKVFSWTFRESFKILSNDLIEITVKSPSIKNFEFGINTINQSDPIHLEYINLDFVILDQYEAFGILRILRGKIDSVSKIIPIIGSPRIYFLSEELNKSDIYDIINKYEITDPLPEGSEIFTQDEFAGMSKFRQASLIKAPSGNLYSFLDLYRNPKRIDPCTGESFPEYFIEEMTCIMKDLNGAFMTEFPPVNLKPELITISSDSNAVIRTMSFCIKIGEETYPFWIIPDLRNTLHGKTTLDAIRILVIKWTDNSLFKGSFLPGPDCDIHLLFSPIALYVFEETISDLNLKIYPRDIEAQAQHLREQIYLLSRCS